MNHIDSKLKNRYQNIKNITSPKEKNTKLSANRRRKNLSFIRFYHTKSRFISFSVRLFQYQFLKRPCTCTFLTNIFTLNASSLAWHFIFILNFTCLTTGFASEWRYQFGEMHRKYLVICWKDFVFLIWNFYINGKKEGQQNTQRALNKDDDDNKNDDDEMCFCHMKETKYQRHYPPLH